MIIHGSWFTAQGFLIINWPDNANKYKNLVIIVKVSSFGTAGPTPQHFQNVFVSTWEESRILASVPMPPESILSCVHLNVTQSQTNKYDNPSQPHFGSWYVRTHARSDLNAREVIIYRELIYNSIRNGLPSHKSHQVWQKRITPKNWNPPKLTQQSKWFNDIFSAVLHRTLCNLVLRRGLDSRTNESNWQVRCL